MNFASLSAFAILSLGLLVAVSVEPLSSSHWDSPIYLYQAKRFNETPLLKSYAVHANAVADQVANRTWPEGESYPESFWRFMRLGNIAILGTSFSFFSDPGAALQAAATLYAFMLAAAVAMTFISVCTLAELFEPDRKRALARAAAACACLYLVSPIFRYLAANLLSEIPSLFLLSAALLTFLLAAIRQSIAIAILCGAILFCLYAVRMEGIWVAFGVLLPLTVAMRLNSRSQPAGKIILTVAGTAAAGFIAYSAFFHPLTDPGLVRGISHILAKKGAPDAVPGYTAIFVAGGLLWIGTIAAWPSRERYVLPVLAVVWAMMIVLPRAGSLQAGPLHSRVLADLMVPFMLLSTVGLSRYFHEWPGPVRRHPGWVTAHLLAASLLVACATPLYGVLRELPIGWRLQYVRRFIAPPEYERNRYAISGAEELAAAIYADGHRSIVVWDPVVTHEQMNVIRYFGAAYPAQADLALALNPVNKKSCEGSDLDHDWREEPALYCVDVDSDVMRSVREGKFRLLKLEAPGRTYVPGRFAGKRVRVLVETGEFRLSELREGSLSAVPGDIRSEIVGE